MTGGSTRRRFLEVTGSTVGVAGLAGALGSAASTGSSLQPAAGTARRPKVAALATVYSYLSHAYHIVGRFIDGFPVYAGHGLHGPPISRLPACSSNRPRKRPIWAEPRLGCTVFAIANPLPMRSTLGTGKLAVDAVLLIAEHGEYPYNERLQKLYPRGRFFGEVLEVFKASGPAVPVFIDKHLSYSRVEAQRDG